MLGISKHEYMPDGMNAAETGHITICMDGYQTRTMTGPKTRMTKSLGKGVQEGERSGYILGINAPQGT
jgi:hypothetical protein